MYIKKRLPYIFLLIIMCIFALCFVACTNEKNENENNGTHTITTVEEAYAVAQDLGFNGTLEDFIASISGKNGADGKDGVNGKSAYEIWLDDGHTGSQTDFLNWLKGTDGLDGTNGSNGQDGKSAYQIWLDNGHSGTETEFFEWLKGSDGQDGTNGSNGQDGKSAYQIWLDNGHSGTEIEFLEWLKGSDGQDGTNGSNGQDGKSAYEIFLKYYPYYSGNEEQWIKALVNNELKIHTITFKSEISEDIIKYVFNGYALTDIPDVPEKEGQTSAEWDIKDFSNITQDIEVNAIYDMRKYVTFHNEFTNDEDITITVNYGEAIDNVPEITEKVGNDSSWSITDFNRITEDMQITANYVTRGLQYILINQKTVYKVLKGEMNIETEELFIPAEYNGKPVTVIESGAFSLDNNNNEDRLLVKVAHLPETITEIRGWAFRYCDKLEHINIPFGVTYIESGAFSYCSSLTGITIPESVTVLGGDMFSYSGLTSITIPKSITSLSDSIFMNCENLVNVTLPNTLTTIQSNAFLGCSALTFINLPNSITSIEGNAFNGCSNLTRISFPDNITIITSTLLMNCTNLSYIILPNIVEYIDPDAFSGCNSLEAVYFKGNEMQFNQIEISEYGNTSFTDATAYFYSENKPTDDGFYWHYDLDGITPIIWSN